jgi:hypothetical protein
MILGTYLPATFSYEGESHIAMEIPLSATEVAYQAILNTIVDPHPFSSQMDEEDLILEPIRDT